MLFEKGNFSLKNHTITPEVFNKSMQHDKISFLPREKIPELKSFLEEMVKKSGKSVWRRLFNLSKPYARTGFIPDWEKNTTI